MQTVYCLCTNEEKCKLFFCSYAIRKRPIGEATLDLHVGQTETMIVIHVKRITKKRNSGSYLKIHLDKISNPLGTLDYP